MYMATIKAGVFPVDLCKRGCTTAFTLDPIFNAKHFLGLLIIPAISVSLAPGLFAEQSPLFCLLDFGASVFSVTFSFALRAFVQAYVSESNFVSFYDVFPREVHGIFYVVKLGIDLESAYGDGGIGFVFYDNLLYSHVLR